MGARDFGMLVLSKDPAFQRGFAAGVLYVLMVEQCPTIIGEYAAMDDEQLLLMASRLGYCAERTGQRGTMCSLRFDLRPTAGRVHDG